MIRDSRDGESVRKALSRHPLAPSGRCLSLACDDESTRAMLESAIRYLPFHERSDEPIAITAFAGRHPSQRDWLGYQEGSAISLYYPAYRNVTTLVFALFHEYGHWLQKHVLREADWESYPSSGLGTIEDAAALLEHWANAFAWYFVGPSVLEWKSPEDHAYFSGLFGANKS